MYILTQSITKLFRIGFLSKDEASSREVSAPFFNMKYWFHVQIHDFHHYSLVDTASFKKQDEKVTR